MSDGYDHNGIQECHTYPDMEMDKSFIYTTFPAVHQRWILWPTLWQVNLSSMQLSVSKNCCWSASDLQVLSFHSNRKFKNYCFEDKHGQGVCQHSNLTNEQKINMNQKNGRGRMAARAYSLAETEKTG